MKSFWGHLSASDVEAAASSKAASGLVASALRPDSLAHAATCARCTMRVRRAKLRRGLLAGLPEKELSEFALRRVERRLFAGQAAPSRAGAPSWFRVALAGAALAGVVLAGRGWSSRPLAPAPERALTLAQVTLDEAGATLRRGADWAPLTVGTQAAEGDALRTGAGRAALSLSPGTGVVLGVNTVVKLARLRDGEVELALEGGKISCAVHPLQPGQRFTVFAGPRRIDVVGTAFSVERRGDDVIVANDGRREPGSGGEPGFAGAPARERSPAVIIEVSHGVVALSDPAGAAGRVRLPGPIRMVAPDGRPAAELVGAQLGEAEAAQLAAAPAWKLAEGFTGAVARLAVNNLPAGSGVEVDGFGVGPAPVEGLFPLGAHHVSATLGGKAVALDVTLSAAGALVGREAFPSPQPPPASTSGVAETAFADEGALADAVKAHVPELKRCYETSLKRGAAKGGKVVVSLSVSARGKVTDVAFAGADLPPDTTACLSSAAKKWKLPGTGSALAIEVPLHLTAQ